MTDLPASLMDLTPALLEELRMQAGVERIARMGTLSVDDDEQIAYACPVATLALAAGIRNTLSDDGEDYQLTDIELDWCTDYLVRRTPFRADGGFDLFIDGWDHPEVPFARSAWHADTTGSRQGFYEYAQYLSLAYFAAYPEHALAAVPLP